MESTDEKEKEFEQDSSSDQEGELRGSSTDTLSAHGDVSIR